MNIIITNVYACRNRGDSAIIEAMCRYFEDRFKNCTIYLSSVFYKENEIYYNQFGYISIPPIWNVPMHSNKIIRLAVAMKNLFLLLLAFLPGCGRMNKALKIYKDADFVIDAGGGSFFSSNKYFFYLGFYQHLFVLWIAKIMKKKTYIAPQSMGPFSNKMDVFFFKKLMNKLDCVMVREQVSKLLMDNMKLHAYAVPDCVFMNNFIVSPSDVCLKSMSLIKPDRCNIGLTVLDWTWAISVDDRDKALNDYLVKIVESIMTLTENRSILIHIFSQTDVATEFSDYKVAGMLSDLLTKQNVNTVIHDANNSASDLSLLYRQMDLFVGSRMHSCIFAVNQAVPVIALAYQPKTIGVMKLVSEKLPVLPIDLFAVDDLTEHMKTLLDNQTEIKNMLKKRGTELQQDVYKSLNQYIKA